MHQRNMQVTTKPYQTARPIGRRHVIGIGGAQSCRGRAMGASSDLSARGGNKRGRRILTDALPEEFGLADLIERLDLIDLPRNFFCF